MEQRIQKILAQWGIASRREAENLIREKRVTINGQVAQIGDKVDPEKDSLCYDGKKLEQRPELLYILLNKPLDVVSTCDDPQKRTTVLDLLPAKLSQGQGLHPVGRLDIDSTGALLLTNDGAITLKLTHPRYHLNKTYHVWVQGCPSESVLEQWRNGVMLDDRMTLPARIKQIKSQNGQTLLQMILSEGKNRQIRRCGDSLGYRVVKLHRVAIGPIRLDCPSKPELILGDYRILDDSEQELLKNYVSTRTQELLVSRTQ